MPLDRSKCRLMTDALIKAFDHVEAQFDRVRANLPHLARREDLGRLWAELKSLQVRMERPRYYVGFLGRSQVGKSSTLNSVLRARPGEEPCTGGQGAPATSTATRIYRRENAGVNGDAAGHACRLRYLTPTQFKARRAGLCEALGFHVEEPDGRIVEELDALIHKAGATPEEDYGPRPAAEGDKVEDYRFFRRLLRSYREFAGATIREAAAEEEGRFELRAEYTNHPDGDRASKYTLLRQVEIAYRSDIISEKIELIDLPGLGARMRADDLLTEGFLPDLDGALIFQSSEQVASKEAYDLLTKLGELYPRMRGRVWMVITKADALTHDHYGYGKETSIFDHIRKTMDDKRVPLSQVLMVGNVFHRKVVGVDGEPAGPIDPSRVCDLLNLERDAQGHPKLPEGFTRHPELRAAFEEVMRDGGIGRLRQVIGERLAEEVEREVRDEVEGRLRSIRKRLAGLVRSARDAARMDRSSFNAAVSWSVGLQILIQDLARDRAIIEAPATAMGNHLVEVFQGICPDELEISHKRLRASHAMYAEVLQETLREECRANFLPRVHGRVSERLGALEQKHGKVRLDGRDGPVATWEDRRSSDEEQLRCLEGIGAGFLAPDLFPNDEAPSLDDDHYRDVMPRKIRAVTHRAAFAAGLRLRGHLDEMIEGLSLLKKAEGDSDSKDPRPYDEILRDLE
jgi:hypothetical protein